MELRLRLGYMDVILHLHSVCLYLCIYLQIRAASPDTLTNSLIA